MSKKLPSVNGRQVIRVLEHYGYRVVRVQGSHHFMSAEGKQSVSVPVHAGRDIKKGTLNAIIKDAGLSHDVFCNRL